MPKKYNIAVAGATGAVGQEILSILAQRRFPVGEISLLASERSAGEVVDFMGRECTVINIEDENFKGIDIGLFSPGASVSKIHAPRAAKAGCVVVDNTSHFRMDKDVPLIVPEVNPDAVAGYKKKNIIANPNCSTIQMVVALKPIHDKYKIKRLVISTYQAVSGAGRPAIDELSGQVTGLFNMKGIETEVFPKQIAFNSIPQIDVFMENDYTKEEMKMVEETKKIFDDDSIGVTATCVRVSVFNCHGESINIETEKPIKAKDVKKLLKDAPGVTLIDNPKKEQYPTQLEAAEMDDVFVGRIRQDDTVENGINMWVVSDNLRKGAALNTVQIAELLIKDYLK